MINLKILGTLIIKIFSLVRLKKLNNKLQFIYLYFQKKQEMEEIIKQPKVESEKKEKINKEVYLNKYKASQSKNQIKKSEKKYSKKYAKSINVIVFNENKKYEEIISNIPTFNCFIYHYGNGDEDDQFGLENFFKEKCKIHIFPGISYGFIQFENIPKFEMKDNIVSFKINFPQGERIVLILYSKININQVIPNSNSNFPVAKMTHNIPGLLILNDFISEKEEKEMVEMIDMNNWHKLTNRRVQHYGYEFVYGSNNIDKSKKIGTLPDFNIDINKSI